MYYSVPNVGSKKNNFLKRHINIDITFLTDWIVKQNIIWDGVVRQFIHINIYVRPGVHKMVGLFLIF